MEEFIQIIIFVGAMVIAVIGQNAKSKKKPMDASPQEVLEDMFPEIELQEDKQITIEKQHRVLTVLGIILCIILIPLLLINIILKADI